MYELEQKRIHTALAAFPEENIDWHMTPELAVTLFLEWGNNDWHSSHPPIRSSDEAVIYFVVDAWHSPPIVRLVRRNTEGATDLLSFALPDNLVRFFHAEYGDLKGVYAPPPPIQAWLQTLAE